MNYEPITSKKQFSALWHQGLLGNKAGSWNTLDEFRLSGFTKKVALSYRGNGHKGPFVAGIKASDVEMVLRQLDRDGWNPADFRILEQFDPAEIRYVLNGEAIYTQEGLSLFYSTENLRMREALSSSGKQVYGLRAKMALEHYMAGPDLDDLMILLDMYSDHAIEFTVFDRCVGQTPHRRMIVWEVRKY